MLTSNKENQSAYEFVRVEDLVPDDHLLRKIDRFIDLSFITEKVSPYYCHDNGRPSIDPIVLFKMIFVGYLLLQMYILLLVTYMILLPTLIDWKCRPKSLIFK